MAPLTFNTAAARRPDQHASRAQHLALWSTEGRATDTASVSDQEAIAAARSAIGTAVSLDELCTGRTWRIFVHKEPPTPTQAVTRRCYKVACTTVLTEDELACLRVASRPDCTAHHVAHIEAWQSVRVERLAVAPHAPGFHVVPVLTMKRYQARDETTGGLPGLKLILFVFPVHGARRDTTRQCS